jgi:preprotein translocase subunit YajC
MFYNLTHLIAMAPPSGGQGGAGSILPTVIMFGSIILIMYFLMIRPQQRRQKEHQRMLENVRKGDKVITSSGIHGTITDVDDTTFEIQVSDNARIKFEKSAIASKKS